MNEFILFAFDFFTQVENKEKETCSLFLSIRQNESLNVSQSVPLKNANTPAE